MTQWQKYYRRRAKENIHFTWRADKGWSFTLEYSQHEIRNKKQLRRKELYEIRNKKTAEGNRAACRSNAVEHKGGEPQQLSKIQILHDIMQKLSENRSCQKKVLTAANPLLFLDAAVIGGRLLIFFSSKTAAFIRGQLLFEKIWYMLLDVLLQERREI